MNGIFHTNNNPMLHLKLTVQDHLCDFRSPTRHIEANFHHS